MIFVDTSAWFACVVPHDSDYGTASDWLKANRERLITTDYVIDETLTLLKARHEYERAVALRARLFSGDLTEAYHVTEMDVRSAWQGFHAYADKAFSVDKHFMQFGNVLVVPAQ